MIDVVETNSISTSSSSGSDLKQDISENRPGLKVRLFLYAFFAK